jgi:uncharacterized protein (TIGR03086 family)
MTATPMPGPSMPDLEPAARAVAALAAGVGDGQLGDPTPCPGMTVRNMLGHLVGLSVAFHDAARKDLGVTTGTNPADTAPDVDDEGRWRTELPGRLTALAAAWRDPAAWDGTTQAGGVTLPGSVAGAVALNELVVHGWDLARATGQPYTPDTADLAACQSFLSASANDRTGTPFGPVIPVPPDASLLDRVIGLSGRNPHWTP